MLAHLAAIHEQVAEALPEEPAVISTAGVLTHAGLARRSRRLARALRRLGLGCRVERDDLAPWESGQDHVALLLWNGPEYLEAMYGAYKARATAVNVNYRYTPAELAHLLADSDARAIVYHGSLATGLAEVRDRLPALRHLVQVDDGSGATLLRGALDYETLLASEPPEPLDLPYAPDDLYVLYTGGTTGMPKGVLWRQEDVFYNSLGGHLPGFLRLDTEERLRAHLALGLGGRALVCVPFMHGAGQWNAFNAFHRGGAVVLPDETHRFDAHAVWRAVEQHRVNELLIVGDAFARPLVSALEERARDLATLRLVVSTGAVLSRTVRDELLTALPAGVSLLESIGGSELGLQAMSTDTSSGHAGIPAYAFREGTVLLREDRRAVVGPGSEETGWIASTGHLPLGYLGDAARTRATFPVIDGVRHVVGGDRGRYLPDGRLLFLGRESACINTGGEKVYAEEVERVVKSHTAVFDALVVGTPSARWGQQVTAIVALRPDHAAPTLDALRAHCRMALADYKLPKALVLASEIVRSPSGKPDYAWARRHAAAPGPPEETSHAP